MKNLNEELGNNKTMLLVLPSSKYNDAVSEISNQLNKDFFRVAYISLNKLLSPLKRGFEDKGFDLDKFFFIDGITKTAIPNPPEVKNTIYVSSPNDMTKLSIAITRMIQNFDPDVIFFDSLSTLLIYEDINLISQFVHSLVNKINAYGIKIVFNCLDGDKEQRLVKDLSLMLDKVVMWEEK